MAQFVYVLEDKKTQLIKIGISVDPEFRAKQVSKDFGCDAVVIGILEVENAYRTEQFIHGMLEDCRVVGEWFEVPTKKKSYLLTYFSDRNISPSKTASPMQEGLLVIQPKSSGMDDLSQTDKTVRDALRQAMAEQQLTQTEIARRLGIKQPSVADLISGRRGRIPESLTDLIDALGLEIVVQRKE